MDREKDPMVKFRSTLVGKNSKGGDRFQLYLGGDQNTGNTEIDALIGVLTEFRENPRGVKIDLHITERVSEGGHKFHSAICFVKTTAESPLAHAPSPTAGLAKGPSLATRERVEKVRESF